MKYKDQKFNELVKAFHKVSPRHVLTVELSVDEWENRRLLKLSKKGRRFKNRLIGLVDKKLKCYHRDRRVIRLTKHIGETYKTNDLVLRRKLGKQLNEIQKEYGLTKYGCTGMGTQIYRDFNIPSVYRCTLAEDVYRGVESILYREGGFLHFHKYYELPSIRAKDISCFIRLKVFNSQLYVQIDDMCFPVKSSELDLFECEELKLITHYLENAEMVDRYAVEQYQLDKTIVDTFRPCYVTLTIEEIRGKKRIYAKIMVEGKPLDKKNEDGTLKHKFGKGVIGTDLGTQSVAYTSKNEIGMFNLAEGRWDAVKKKEREIRRVQRKIDRSRRATNPDNYNPNGTVKEGSKNWVKSKNYRKLQTKLRDLNRSISNSKKYAINEQVNHLRELADEVHIEEKNAKQLQQRIKVVTKDGKVEHHRNHGRAIQMRTPGYFQSQLKTIFERTGGTYIEVKNQDYCASQFNHFTGEYNKKGLETRMYELTEGVKVQRDIYSSLLLFCMKSQSEINSELVKEMFPEWFRQQNEFISRVKREKIKILNSGIKI